MAKKLQDLSLSENQLDNLYIECISNNIDNSKIVKVYEPKLPVFTLENSVNRNDIWKKIDDKCTDIYWTQACRSGLQYHNNVILSVTQNDANKEVKYANNSINI